MTYKLFENYLPKEAIDIRYTVFILEQGFPEDADLDELDFLSTHIVVYYRRKPIATARMFRENETTFHIGRVAVLQEYHHKRVGTFVVQKLEERIYELGGKEVYIHSQIDKTNFYEKCGYKASGDVFDDAGYPHIKMSKTHQCQ